MFCFIFFRIQALWYCAPGGGLSPNLPLGFMYAHREMMKETLSMTPMHDICWVFLFSILVCLLISQLKTGEDNGRSILDYWLCVLVITICCKLRTFWLVLMTSNGCLRVKNMFKVKSRVGLRLQLLSHSRFMWISLGPVNEMIQFHRHLY